MARSVIGPPFRIRRRRRQPNVDRQAPSCTPSTPPAASLAARVRLRKLSPSSRWPLTTSPPRFYLNQLPVPHFEADRTVHDAEPLVARLAPFRLGPAPPLAALGAGIDERPHTRVFVGSHAVDISAVVRAVVRAPHVVAAGRHAGREHVEHLHDDHVATITAAFQHIAGACFTSVSLLSFSLPLPGSGRFFGTPPTQGLTVHAPASAPEPS